MEERGTLSLAISGHASPLRTHGWLRVFPGGSVHSPGSRPCPPIWCM